MCEEVLPIYRLPACCNRRWLRKQQWLWAALLLWNNSVSLADFDSCEILTSSGWFLNVILHFFSNDSVPNHCKYSCLFILMKMVYIYNNNIICAFNPQTMEDIFSRSGRSEEMDSLLLMNNVNPDCTLRLCALQKLKVCLCTSILIPFSNSVYSLQ